MNPNSVHLYFHSPCFDGIVSAAIASEYFEQVKGFPHTQLRPANYHLRDEWLGTGLDQPAAVVDFLYHPGAQFWVDHHSTAFLSDGARRDYEERGGPEIFYDSSASSCAVLIWEQWGRALPRPPGHFEKLVEWADRIDSARYESVEEAVGLEAPAMQINLALAMYQGDAFSQHLVWLFRTETLESVAKRAEVQRAFALGRKLQQLGQKRLGASIHLTADGIAVFDVDAEDVLMNRYAPFHFFPQARYSVGVVRSQGRSKLTAMRNPWIEFPSAPLGTLCLSLGGGGHRRVGSVLVRDKDPADLLSQLVRMISGHEETREDMVLA